MPEPRATPTIPYATPPEFRRDALIVRRGRATGIVFIATGAVVLAFCGLLLLVGGTGPRADFLLAVGIGGVSIVAGAYNLTDREPRLILSDAAFLSTIGNRIELRWADLTGAETVTHSDEVTYLILRLVDPAAQRQPPTLWNRPDFDRPPKAEYEDILLPISGLDASPDLILRQIRSRIAVAHDPV